MVEAHVKKADEIINSTILRIRHFVDAPIPDTGGYRHEYSQRPRSSCPDSEASALRRSQWERPGGAPLFGAATRQRGLGPHDLLCEVPARTDSRS